LNTEHGRFTLYGGDAVERKIGALVVEAGKAIEDMLPPESIRALVLIGGYGRGEGGVESQGEEETPHNNLDFLLILNDDASSPSDRIKERLNNKLHRLGRFHGIGMDLGIVTTGYLKHAVCLVMWHDMRFGHKTILGDAEFVPSLTQFTPERIEAADIRNLLVNRGTLLLINQMLLEAGPLSEEGVRTVVRHAMKAIIGYGDALLFSKGAYHWSYAEKQIRMAAHQEIPAAFRALYDEAIEFRFRPDYAPYLCLDLGAWMRTLVSVLEPVHLACEADRLNAPALTWDGYTNLTFRHTLHEGRFTLRNVARKSLRMLQSLPPLPKADLLTRLGYRCGGWRGALPALFPVILYGLPLPSDQDRAQKLLKADNTTQADLRRAYLRSWATYGDTNFHAVVQKLGLSLEPGRTVEVAQ
jgi:hypothetical protein